MKRLQIRLRLRMMVSKASLNVKIHIRNFGGGFSMKKFIYFVAAALLLSAVICPVSAKEAWPANGEIYGNSAYSQEQTQLDIVIENQSCGYASLVKLYTASGDLVRCLFAGQPSDGSGSIHIAALIPGGDYVLKLGIGQNWYGLAESFGAAGAYSTLFIDENTSVITLDAGYRYTLYIDASLGTADAQDVESKAIPYADF